MNVTISQIQQKFSSRLFILLIPFIFLFIFLILPILNLFIYSITQQNQITFNNFEQIINHPLNKYFLLWDIYQAAVTTILSIIIGIPFAFFLNEVNFPGKKLLRNLVIIPFLLPPIVVLMCFITVFGTGGWINSLFITIFNQPFINIFNSTEGIILAHLFYNLPLMIRITETSFRAIDPELLIVSRSLGVSRTKFFFKVELPQIMPSILIASLLVFIYAFNSFAIVLILGGVQYQTIEVRIYSLVKNSFVYGQAAALTMFQLLFNLLIIIIYLFLTSKYKSPNKFKRKSVSNFNIKKSGFQFRSVIKFLFFGINAIIVFVICILPLLAIFLRAFTDNEGNLTPQKFSLLLESQISNFIGLEPISMILNSLIFGLLVLIFSILLALALNYGLNYETSYKGIPENRMKNLTSIIVIIPLTVSSISLAFSIFTLYRNSFLYSNASIIIVAMHVLIAFPFANRIIAEARDSIDRSYISVGRSLGISRYYSFIKIELPIIVPYLIVAGLFSLAISLGEFGATNFVSTGNFATIPVGIYRLINTRRLDEATAFSVLLITLTLCLFYIIEKLGKYDFKV